MAAAAAQAADDSASAAKEEFVTLYGARVLSPCDMADDIILDAVTKATDLLGPWAPNGGLDPTTDAGDVNMGASGSSGPFHPDKQGGEICDALKKHFDEKWDRSWVVCMGKNFGCHATHERSKFIYFYLGGHAFMLYKV